MIELFIAIFILKLIMNNIVFNLKNNTKYFIFLLNPFSSNSMHLTLVCFFTICWKTDRTDSNNLKLFKIVSNILNVSFLLILGWLIYSHGTLQAKV